MERALILVKLEAMRRHLAGEIISGLERCGLQELLMYPRDADRWLFEAAD